MAFETDEANSAPAESEPHLCAMCHKGMSSATGARRVITGSVCDECFHHLETCCYLCCAKD